MDESTAATNASIKDQYAAALKWKERNSKPCYLTDHRSGRSYTKEENGKILRAAALTGQVAIVEFRRSFGWYIRV